MIVYLGNIALIILGYFLWIYSEKFDKGKLYFCVQVTIQWILISGLRSTAVGADTWRYKYMFEEALGMSWGETFNDFLLWIQGSELVKDPGYTLFQKIFQIFSKDYQLFLIFVAILFTVPMSVWVYRNSENPLLSYIIFSCLFYSFFAITGIRQTLVTGFMVFIGSELLKKKKCVLYYLMLLLLIPIHKSVVALAIAPFIRKVKINGITILIWSVAIAFAYLFRSQLMSLLSGIVGYSEYDKFYEGAGASTFAYLYYALTLVGIIFHEKIDKKGESMVIAFNMVAVGAILLPLTFINQSAMRAVQYFSVYLMFYVPQLTDFFDKKDKNIVTTLAVLALVVLLILNKPNYTFFWQ